MNTFETKGHNKSIKKRKAQDWLVKQFAYPQRKIRLATTFSGIGAIEYAFKRLGIKHVILFAGDINDKCKESYFANYDIKEEQWHYDILLLIGLNSLPNSWKSQVNIVERTNLNRYKLIVSTPKKIII